MPPRAMARRRARLNGAGKYAGWIQRAELRAAFCTMPISQRHNLPPQRMTVTNARSTMSPRDSAYLQRSAEFVSYALSGPSKLFTLDLTVLPATTSSAHEHAHRNLLGGRLCSG